MLKKVNTTKQPYYCKSGISMSSCRQGVTQIHYTGLHGMCLKHQRKVSFIASVLFLLSLFGQIYLANNLAIKGKDIVALDRQRTELEKELSALYLEAANSSSLSYVESRAQALGFVENTEFVHQIPSDAMQALVPSY